MKLRCRLPMVAAIAAVFIGFSTAASSADYPSKPIKIVVPYPPGGGADDFVRFLAPRLSDRLKQPVVIENRTGATGMIGTTSVARATPDGYTIGLGHADTMSINPHVFKNIAYDVKTDLVPIAVFGVRPFVLVVSNSVPVNGLADFLKLTHTQPGKYTFASPGIGSSAQIAMEMLLQASGGKMQHIPYQGAAPAAAAVLGSQVDSMMSSLAVMQPNHKAGKLKILGITSSQRLVAAAPDIATLTEQGLPLSIVDWYGFVAPAKMPPDVLATLNREFNTLLGDAEVRNYLTTKTGLQLLEAQSPAELRVYLDKMYLQWGKTIADAKIQVE